MGLRYAWILFLLANAVRGGDAFQDAEARYAEYLKRPSLEMRTRGRERFAGTADARALHRLARDYRDARKPRDHERYLIASICSDAFRDEEHLAEWEAWRRQENDSEDAWLWFKAVIAECSGGRDYRSALRAAPGNNMYLRSAVLRAIAEVDAEAGLTALASALEDLPVSRQEREVVIETSAAVLATVAPGTADSQAFRLAAGRLAQQLDEDLSARTHLTVARCLARALESDTIALDSKYWRAVLRHEAEQGAASDSRYAKSKLPTYFGVEGTGKRVVYVLDLSDSMLTPLTDDERRDLRRPITGRPATELTPEDRLPWDKIRTRFDAAREYTKLSLRQLAADTMFGVVVFGTKANTLKSTPRLMEVSKGRVACVCRELDSFRPGPSSRDCPHGSLLGYTNLHGGLRLAFKLTQRRAAGEFEYVDPKAIGTGADTIFLLSDGDPSWDDWGPVADRREASDEVGHPESLVGYTRTDTVQFCGPYWQPRFLLDDLRRLNFFRHAELNCVGMGEANVALLSGISEGTGGRVRVLGAKK